LSARRVLNLGVCMDVLLASCGIRPNR